MTATLVAPIKRERERKHKSLDPLAEVTGIDELLQRVEVTKALRAGIRYALRAQTRLQEQNKLEAWSVVISKLIERLCNGKSRRITHEKFLVHPNRGGWLNLFARNTTLEWLGERIRIAQGDARVRVALLKGIDPEETFTREQERLAAENESLTYDPYQFAGTKGHGPDSMSSMSDGGTIAPAKPWRDFDFLRVDDDPRVIETQSLGDAEDELIALIHQELAKMTFEDREFFKEYVDSRYERQTTPAERKRFQRLRDKIRAAVTNS